ncbi:MAG: hypothetical protein ABL896_15395, partial [Hylemonella sp.]
MHTNTLVQSLRLGQRVLCSLLLASAAAYAQQGVTSRQILIGQNISLEGGKNEYGTAVLDGINAYLQEANASGGVHGRAIVLKTLDDDS